MRCFLAIELDEKIKKEIVRLQKLISRQGAKLVEPQNLHLTLKFFGEIDDKKINVIKKELSDFNFGKINCSLGNIGFFPSSSFIRVMWISLEPQEKIKELTKKINEKLKMKDERFESHITLARIKFIKDKGEFIKEIKELKAKPVEISIDSFSLKKSTLTKKGPVYETIKEFKI